MLTVIPANCASKNTVTDYGARLAPIVRSTQQQANARQCKAKQGKARQSKAKQGKARQSKLSQAGQPELKCKISSTSQSKEKQELILHLKPS